MLASWHPELRTPQSIGFIALRSSYDAALDLANGLGMMVHPYMPTGTWAVMWDYMIGSDPRGMDYEAVKDKIWALGRFDIKFKWIRQWTPEMDDPGIDTNLYYTLDQFMDELLHHQTQTLAKVYG